MGRDTFAKFGNVKQYCLANDRENFKLQPYFCCLQIVYRDSMGPNAYLNEDKYRCGARARVLPLLIRIAIVAYAERFASLMLSLKP